MKLIEVRHHAGEIAAPVVVFEPRSCCTWMTLDDRFFFYQSLECFYTAHELADFESAVTSSLGEIVSSEDLIALEMKGALACPPYVLGAMSAAIPSMR